MRPYTVTQVRWPQHAADLLAIRRAVFVDEQGVPEALEVDGRDDGAWHLLARDAAELPVGCARVLADAHIGRLAVLRSVRGQGIGRALLDAAVALARRLGMGDLHLHAQVRARGFYEAAGFIAEGDEFPEAGIAHVAMRLPAGGTVN
jgi:predicted GNAT family N-acyltransferase